MSNKHHTQYVHPDALKDPNISTPAAALAATLITGGSVYALRFSNPGLKLLMWELEQAGHIGGNK